MKKHEKMQILLCSILVGICMIFVMFIKSCLVPANAHEIASKEIKEKCNKEAAAKFKEAYDDANESVKWSQERHYKIIANIVAKETDYNLLCQVETVRGLK